MICLTPTSWEQPFVSRRVAGVPFEMVTNLQYVIGLLGGSIRGLCRRAPLIGPYLPMSLLFLPRSTGYPDSSAGHSHLSGGLGEQQCSCPDHSTTPRDCHLLLRRHASPHDSQRCPDQHPGVCWVHSRNLWGSPWTHHTDHFQHYQFHPLTLPSEPNFQRYVATGSFKVLDRSIIQDLDLWFIGGSLLYTSLGLALLAWVTFGVQCFECNGIPVFSPLRLSMNCSNIKMLNSLEGTWFPLVATSFWI